MTSRVIEYVKGSSISGTDLLALARGCPELKYLYLSARLWNLKGLHPRGESIDDTTMELFASALPKLEDLGFGIENCSILTYKAVVSLIRHCRELNSLIIAVDVCIPDLIQGLEKLAEEFGDPLFPNFMFAYFTFDENIQHNYADVSSLASRLMRIAPRIREFGCTNGTEDDDEFANEVEEIAGRKWWREPSRKICNE